MKAENSSDRDRAVVAWLKNHTGARRGSRAHLVLIAGGALLAVLVLAAGVVQIARHHHHPAPVAAATPPAAATGAQVGSNTAHAPTLVGAMVGTVSPAAVPAVPPATAQAAPVVAAPAAVIAPPAGLIAGETIETIADADRFGQYNQVSQRAVGSARTSWQSYVAPANSPAWQETFTGWFKLAAPASVVVLRRDAGASAKNVSANVDGTAIGELGYGAGSVTTAVVMAPGWHSFTITLTGKSLFYRPDAVDFDLEIGAGTTPPAPVVPYAVVQPVAAPAPATTAAPHAGLTSKPAPAAAATTTLASAKASGTAKER